MTRADLLAFLRTPRVGVLASVSAAGAAQAAVVGIAVSDAFEIVFDTVATSRKAQNLRHNPHVALVIGGVTADEERTVQIDGVADEPAGAELERLKAVYYAAYPDGPSRLSWPGLIYVRVRPTWLRHSDFTRDPPAIIELDAEALGRLA